MKERLQKILSRAGVSSRRRAEELMQAGRVRVDGRVVTELGTRVDPKRERVEVDGRRIFEQERIYIVLHKPRAVMSTMSDPEGRKTVADLVRRAGARVVPIGRLDYHTSGALLMTNDGDFAAVIGHPSKGALKTYVAKVSGVVDDAGLERLRASIEIDGRRTQPAKVEVLRVEGDKTWLEVTLTEGRNRQVRRLGEFSGYPVMRLARQSVAGVSVEGLRPGEWRYLTADELSSLRQSYGVPKQVPRAPARAAPARPVGGRSQARIEPARPGRTLPERPRRPAPERAGRPAPERSGGPRGPGAGERAAPTRGRRSPRS